MKWLKSLWTRFDRWWWRDPVLRERHVAEEEVRRLGGKKVEWPK